jgi:endonuclease YncB( thermonuclease family)
MQSRTRPARTPRKGILFLPFLALVLAHEAGAEEPVKSPAVRDVTPSGIIRVYRSLEPTAVSEPNLPKFADVQVLPDGALRSGTKIIQLYGITLPERKKLCTSSLGVRWTCGVTAYVALRNIVQSRSITCNVLIESEHTVLGRCKVEETDISAWLLQEGWAELAPSVGEKLYADAAALAKTRAVGLWGNGPPESTDKLHKRY